MTTDSEFIEVIAAIHAGDVATLQRLLADNPGLAAGLALLRKRFTDDGLGSITE